jgi:predicted XRE-type DNA-binding protein
VNDASDQVEVGSGNVFSDLGFDPQEAAELAARSACTRRIARIKEQRGWNQAQLGDAIGMRQSEVSLLLRGKVSRFSLERLLHALNALGIAVHITLVEDAAAGLRVDDRVDIQTTA